MGLGAFACGVGGAKKAFGGFGAFEAWQTAGLNANKKLLISLGAFACGVGGTKRRLEGLEGLTPGQTAGLNANKKLLIWALVPLPAGLGVPLLPWQATKESRSTNFACGVGMPLLPVPGAAPALAKAGVGGLLLDRFPIEACNKLVNIYNYIIYIIYKNFSLKTCKLFALFWLEENIWTMPFVIEKAWEIHEIPWALFADEGRVPWIGRQIIKGSQQRDAKVKVTWRTISWYHLNHLYPFVFWSQSRDWNDSTRPAVSNPIPWFIDSLFTCSIKYQQKFQTRIQRWKKWPLEILQKPLPHPDLCWRCTWDPVCLSPIFRTFLIPCPLSFRQEFQQMSLVEVDISFESGLNFICWWCNSAAKYMCFVEEICWESLK